MTELSKAEALEMSEALRERFLRGPRTKAHQLPHVTDGDGLFDMEKIFDVHAAAAAELARPKIVSREDASPDWIEVAQARRDVPLQPPKPTDHYVYNVPDTRGLPRLRAVRLKNAYLSYDITRVDLPQFYIFTEDGALVNGLFFGGSPFLDEPQETIDAPCVFADDYFARFNICHLLFDKLPRAILGRQMFGNSHMILFWSSNYVRDLAELVGMGATTLLDLGRRGTVRLKDLVVFTDSFTQLAHPARYGHEPHSTILTELRDSVYRAAGAPSDGPKRYFLRRAADLPRGVENADEVSKVLRRHDFSEGDPAELSVKEQMALFLGVECLAGVHGAGLTNMIFMERGSTLLELMPPLCATNSYWPVARGLGYDYRHLVCHDPEMGAVDALNRQHDVSHNRRNVVVPPKELDALLGEIVRA